jgi:hypothetical protein
MLRIRDEKGNATELGDSQFVEICDQDGAIAVLIYKDAGGLIHTVRAGDPEAKKYEELFRVKFVPLVKLNLG